MKIYLAGMKRAYLDQLAPQSPVLVSYAEPPERNLIPLLAGRDVVLDSGAFTAWRLGRPIDLAAYCAFLKGLQGISACIALDVIQGTATQQLVNIEQMERADLATPVWPVYHEGDDPELLTEYVRRGYRKIAIAGTVSRGQAALIDWIWSVLNRIPPSASLCYHGLAMTQQAILGTMQGWLDSVDSTTWLSVAQYGIKGTAHLFNGRSPAFYREIGRMLIEDIARNGVQAERIEQLPLFEEMA